MTLARLVTPGAGLRRWHRILSDALSRDGVVVELVSREAPQRPAAVALLDELEALLLARRRAGLFDPAPGAATHRTEGQPDWIFDLSGRPEPEPGSVFPVYGGAVGDDARDALLLCGAPARIGLAKKDGDRLLLLAQAQIAIERPGSLAHAREAVATRLVTMIRALARRGTVTPLEVINVAPAGAGAVAGFLARSLAQRARSRLGRLLAYEGHWRIGWRRPQDDGVRERLEWPGAARWTFLADDRKRYYADPLVFVKDGVTHVFCEEYPYATRKGVISWFPLDSSGGPAHAPRVVLEAPVHLSYPFVFEHEGQIWMAPESSGSRSLALYRADPFPDKWVLDRVLVADADLSDATLFEHEGRWWMTATTREDDGSSWDCMSLYAAPSPLGPWRQCGKGPALIDTGAARPAGRVFRRDDGLWRPAQDCAAGYGAGLSLCRIDHLDETGLRQTIARRLGPPPGVRAVGVHTLEAGGGYEFIDLCGWRGKAGA